MRYINKEAGQPDCIADFVKTQLDSRPSEDEWESFPVDYSSFQGKAKRTLLNLLLSEQKGLCAYTGIDISQVPLLYLQPSNDRYWYFSHIEHMKRQEICIQELIDTGKTPKKDWGDDLNYHNVVAALLVNGKKSTKSEWFGAVLHTKQNEIYVLPTLQECEEQFVFDRMGGIKGMSEDAQKNNSQY